MFISFPIPLILEKLEKPITVNSGCFLLRPNMKLRNGNWGGTARNEHYPQGRTMQGPGTARPAASPGPNHTYWLMFLFLNIQFLQPSSPASFSSNFDVTESLELKGTLTSSESRGSQSASKSPRESLKSWRLYPNPLRFWWTGSDPGIRIFKDLPKWF